MKSTGDFFKKIYSEVSAITRVLFPRYLSFFAWWFIVIFYANSVAENKRWTLGRVISNDVISYYAYLPAYFIHHDLRLEFVKKDREGYAARQMYWPETLPGGDLLIKTTMGMSIFYAPFFACAHIEAKNSGLEADGFSDPYHRWIIMGCALYGFIGLWYLRKLLLLFFPEGITALTMILIAIGTNYFYYATEETMLTHNISFMLIAAFVYYSIQWHNQKSWSRTLAVGITGGLIILVRPVNITIALFFLLYGIAGIKEQIVTFWKYRMQVLTMVTIAVILFIPQMLYWKLASGHFLTNPYTTERFYFNNPHIIEGLFSYRKGWLLYSPLMIFSLAGFFVLRKINRKLIFAVVCFCILQVYVIFSWWDWWYGGSFGARAMVDIMPILSLPFAAFFHWLFHLKKNRVIMIPVFLSVLFFVKFYQVAHFQYRHGLLHWSGMTKESYHFLFLKRHFTEEEVKHLQTLFKYPDWQKAKTGVDEYMVSPF